MTESVVTSCSSDKKFRSLIIKLAQKFKSGDLENLKFYFEDVIADGKLEKLDSTLKVFDELLTRRIIGPQKLEDLRRILEDIDRSHFIKMVDDFEDSLSTNPLKPKEDNYLAKSGYHLSIKGGRHFETKEGEFVELQSGSNYALILTNNNNHRCECKIEIDGYGMFKNGFLLQPGRIVTIERPGHVKKKFKFFAIADAPENSGINAWRKSNNGIVKIVFSPEKADMNIVCNSTGQTSRTLTCSLKTTDCEFYEMVASAFHAPNVTIMANSWKPLGKKDVLLTEYGIKDGSQITVNMGGKGGDFPYASIRNTLSPTKNRKWRAGATTLEGESCKSFIKGRAFPIETELAVTLNLRLVARSDIRSLPSSGNCTPLARATLTPPPVPD